MTLQRDHKTTVPEVQALPHMDGGWAVKRYGSTRASRRFKSKSEAVRWARRLSRRQRAILVIYRRDCTIEKKIGPLTKA